MKNTTKFNHIKGGQNAMLIPEYLEDRDLKMRRDETLPEEVGVAVADRRDRGLGPRRYTGRYGGRASLSSKQCCICHSDKCNCKSVVYFVRVRVFVLVTRC